VRLLFTSVPGVGHLHPMLPLARAALERGDDVLWATGADGCARLRGVGIDVAEAGMDEAGGIAEFHRRHPEAGAVAPDALPDFMFPRLFGAVRAAAMLHDLGPIAAGWAPDALVCDAAELAGPIVAATLGVPNVTHAFGALLPAARVAAAVEHVAPLWHEHGLDPRPFCGCYDHLYLDIYPPSLQTGDLAHLGPSQLVRPEGVATAGEPVPEWDPEDAELPLLYLTLGTVFSSDAVLSVVLDATADLALRVVVTVGPRGDPASLGPQPCNVRVARYIGQQELLPQCAGVVSHGGSGTFLATLAAGLPQVCLPQAADQFLNAAAGEAAGCAIAIRPGDLSPDAVRAAVARLLDDATIRAGAQRLRDEIASMPPVAEAARRIAALVR
jgi:UDP:flavonoid glycosyltransferase YjiC (YdhE family)